jgi:protein-S-isoprenylcysteine O-methyltransferase Ste14
LRLLQHILLVIACLIFAGFVAGYLRLFRRPGGTPPEMQAMAVLSGLAAALQIAALAGRRVDWPSFVPALGLYLAAAALYLWTAWTTRRRRLSIAFSADRPEFLLSDGPYRMIRHPFYTSYMLYWTAGLVATWRPWLAPAVALMGGCYLWAARREERKFAQSPLAAAYRAYQAATGMFVPKLSGRR